MNKSAIQKYAIWARTEMITQVEQRAYQYGITADGYGEENAMVVQGRALSNQEQEQRWELIQQIKHKGFTQVMEEVAYTWFNRFIALRFMEVNNYLPTHIRVFSDATGAFKPEILSSAMQIDLDGLDRAKVAEMIDANQTEELYRYLLVTQCNALNEALPKMFEKMGGYTEILLPNNILRNDGVLGRMVNDIPEEDWGEKSSWDSKDTDHLVQIIGWLYQFYNTEPKAAVFAKKSGKISKNEIPAATQLFTPDWIVRYMVENSLGRLWKEHIAANARDEYDEVPGDKNEVLLSKWKYYLHDAEQEPVVEKQLAEIRYSYKDLRLQDIKFIDPCMGSGHILVYAFDVFMQIYQMEGWSQREAAASIVEHNLYGLDIDDRAAQLAYFAVMMKARQYDRRIFSRGIRPNLYSIQESNTINRRHLKFFGWQMSDLERNMALNQINALLDEFMDAKEFGSILNICTKDWELLYRFILSVDFSGQMTLEAMGLENTKDKLFELVQIAAIMAQKYDVVATNPPYMGAGGMGMKLSDFVKKHYPDSKSDLFAVFIEKCGQMLKKNGYQAMITQHAWMFLSSYEKLRAKLIYVDVVNMAHLGPRAFEEIGGEVVQTTTFIFRKSTTQHYNGVYCRLTEPNTQDAKEKVYLEGKCQYTTSQNSFLAIPGTPFAYWLSPNALSKFSMAAIGEKALLCQGLTTTDNEKYVRFWYEPDIALVGFNMASSEIAQNSNKKWFPFNKGGSFCKWYGNNELVVNYENNGAEIKADVLRKYTYLKTPDFVVKNSKTYFQEGLTWSALSNDFSIRWFPVGAICADKGQGLFAPEDILYYCCGLLNSVVAKYYLRVVSPTLDFNCGYVRKIPYVTPQEEAQCMIERLVKENIAGARDHWDSFETSWDFQRHPLLYHAAFSPAEIAAEEANGYLPLNTLADAYRHWEQACNDRFNQLKANEEELNRIFIDIYGLQDELTPEVEDKDVTVRKADLGRDIRSLISYAVGCMFGRYSLNVDGLAYAGGEWDASKYQTIIPDADNIIPICDDDYFDDDITARFVQWVETVYGKETLEENLKFIANALGGKGTPRQVIRNYFLNDFYADHLKIYQKRPIYWLFDSGKKNGFKALIYMHRYQSDLLARMRTDYVHEMQERYRTQLAHLTEAVSHASASERVKLNKQLKKIQDQALELQKYEEKIHQLADQNISIDLDDGVKHNYALFADVLAKIK